MTDDGREFARWQGNVDARLKAAEDRAAGVGKLATDHANRLTKMETRQNVMWTAVGTLAGMIGAAVFKLWTSGAF